MNKGITKSGERISTIDGLRAIACLSVVFHHARFLPENFPFDFGRFGVLLFFIISGYCIVLAFRSLTSKPIKEFLIRRIFRLYPAYWAAILLSILIGYQEFTIPKVIANLTMFQTALGLPDISGNFWTLFYELLFYIIVTLFLFRGVERTKKSFSFMLIILLALALFSAILKANNITAFRLPVHPINWLSFFYYGGVIAVISGIAHAENAKSFFKSSERNLGIAFTMFTLISFALIFYFTRFIFENVYWQYLVYFVAICLFYFFLNFRVSFPPLITYIGKISFSVYLAHNPFIFSGIADGLNHMALIRLS